VLKLKNTSCSKSAPQKQTFTFEVEVFLNFVSKSKIGNLPSSTLSCPGGYVTTLLEHEVSVSPRRSFASSSSYEERYVFEHITQEPSSVPILRSIPRRDLQIPTTSTTATTSSDPLNLMKEALIDAEDNSRSVDKRVGIHWLSEAERLLHQYSSTASELLPWLYLSGEIPPCNQETIQRLDIRVIINCAGEVVPNAFESGFNQGERHVSYLTLCLRDGPFEDVFSLFYRVIQAIEAARRNGGAALIHCHQGVSRSATFAIAYLMWAGGLSFACAYNYTRTIREVVSPNAGFLCQLVEWEAHLRSLSTLVQNSTAFQPERAKTDLTSSFSTQEKAQPGAFPIIFRLAKLFDGCYESGPLFSPAAAAGESTTSPESHSTRQPIKMCLQLIRSTDNRAIIPAAPALIRAYDRDIVLVVAGACVDTRRNRRGEDQSVIGVEAYSVVGSKFSDSSPHSDKGAPSREREKSCDEPTSNEDTNGPQNSLRSLVREMALWGGLAVQPQGLQEDVLEYLSASPVRKRGVLSSISSTFSDADGIQSPQTEILKNLLGSSFIRPPACAIQWLLAQDVVFASSSAMDSSNSQTETNFFQLLEERCRVVDESGRLSVDLAISEIQRGNRPSSSDGIVRSPAVGSSPRSRHSADYHDVAFNPRSLSNLIVSESAHRHESPASVTQGKITSNAVVPILKLHFVPLSRGGR